MVYCSQIIDASFLYVSVHFKQISPQKKGFPYLYWFSGGFSERFSLLNLLEISERVP
jgi:hypothetical protein